MWEALRPRRKLTASLRLRWASNFGLALINTAVVRLCLPALEVAVAVAVAEEGGGWIACWVPISPNHSKATSR